MGVGVCARFRQGWTGVDSGEDKKERGRLTAQLLRLNSPICAVPPTGSQSCIARPKIPTYTPSVTSSVPFLASLIFFPAPNLLSPTSRFDRQIMTGRESWKGQQEMRGKHTNQLLSRTGLPFTPLRCT